MRSKIKVNLGIIIFFMLDPIRKGIARGANW